MLPIESKLRLSPILLLDLNAGEDCEALRVRVCCVGKIVVKSSQTKLAVDFGHVRRSMVEGESVIRFLRNSIVLGRGG